MNKESTVQVIYLRSHRVKKDLFKGMAPAPERSPQDEKAKKVQMAELEKASFSCAEPSDRREEI